jgi:hypothetical protein
VVDGVDPSTVPQGYSASHELPSRRDVCRVLKERYPNASKFKAVQCNEAAAAVPNHMGSGSHMTKVLYGHRGLNSDTREAITRPPTQGTVLPCGTCALEAEMCGCPLCVGEAKEVRMHFVQASAMQ